jgi:hypothetical protein
MKSKSSYTPPKQATGGAKTAAVISPRPTLSYPAKPPSRAPNSDAPLPAAPAQLPDGGQTEPK